MQGGPGTPRQLGGLAGSALRGAGSRMIPALDFLATNLIGDSPALTNALRCLFLRCSLPRCMLSAAAAPRSRRRGAAAVDLLMYRTMHASSRKNQLFQQ